MKLVDLNVLIYAINKDSAEHSRVQAWWENALNSEEPVGLAWIVVLGFLRITTNPRVFSNTLSSAEAIEQVEQWLAHPNTILVAETEQQWSVLKDLLRQTGTSGNRTTDAHLASLAIAYNSTLVSCDTDFARFSRLRWENPAAVE